MSPEDLGYYRSLVQTSGMLTVAYGVLYNIWEDMDMDDWGEHQTEYHEIHDRLSKIADEVFDLCMEIRRASVERGDDGA